MEKRDAGVGDPGGWRGCGFFRVREIARPSFSGYQRIDIRAEYIRQFDQRGHAGICASAFQSAQRTMRNLRFHGKIPGAQTCFDSQGSEVFTEFFQQFVVVGFHGN